MRSVPLPHLFCLFLLQASARRLIVAPFHEPVAAQGDTALAQSVFPPGQVPPASPSRVGVCG
jgi:hypothetical protein